MKYTRGNIDGIKCKYCRGDTIYTLAVLKKEEVQISWENPSGSTIFNINVVLSNLNDGTWEVVSNPKEKKLYEIY